MYKNKVVPYLFILPFLIFAITFLIYPFCENVVNSFIDAEYAGDTTTSFAGMANYIDLFMDTKFHYSLINTLILIVLVVIFQVGIALILALLVSMITKFATFFKVSFFMPIVISASAIGLMFKMFYDPEYGALNQIREFLNQDKIVWLDSDNIVRCFSLIVIPVIWQYIGFYFVIFMAALTNISDEIIEASEIDGCNRFHQIWYVKLPMLRNIISTVAVLAITGTLKVFDLPYMIAKDGYPGGRTHFLGTLLFKYGFNGAQPGIAAAFAVVMVILGVILSAAVNKIFKQVDYL